MGVSSVVIVKLMPLRSLTRTEGFMNTVKLSWEVLECRVLVKGVRLVLPLGLEGRME